MSEDSVSGMSNVSGMKTLLNSVKYNDVDVAVMLFAMR